MKLFFTTDALRVGIACLFFTLLIGCQSQQYWNPEPDFGSTVNAAIKAQAANPNAPQKSSQVQSGMDGVSAQKSVESYQNSFDKSSQSGKGLTIRSNSVGGSGQ